MENILIMLLKSIKKKIAKDTKTPEDDMRIALPTNNHQILQLFTKVKFLKHFLKPILFFNVSIFFFFVN